jgi:SulP family sulfate permease
MQRKQSVSLQNVIANFKGNFFGGITAGVIALPLALAFGVASGAGAAAGLYGAILVGFFAAIFGGTKTQISGPTGPITVIVASIVATHPGEYNFIFFTILLAGVFQILFGLVKLGKLIQYVPYPVISGFMSGIGVIIIILQINPLLGLKMQGNPWLTLSSLFQSIQLTNFSSLFLGVLTLMIVFLTPGVIGRKVPPALIALVTVSALSVFLGLDVHTIGKIPEGFPAFKIPWLTFEDIPKIFPLAITLAILGSVDSLLTSLVADSLTKTHHNSNKELIGQGIGNIVASLFGGLAGAGATMRTVVNIKTGGHDRLSGVIHSVFLVIILMGAGPLASQVPMAVLAGILIKVGFDIIDYKFIKVIEHAPKNDLYVMLLVFVLTVFDDLIFAVGAGIVLSSILFAFRVAEQTQFNIQEVDNEELLKELVIEQRYKYKIRVVHINGVFFFGSASRMLTRVDDLLGTKYLIIDCSKISEMDISAIFALEDIIIRLKDKGIVVMLVLGDRDTCVQFLKLGVLKIIRRRHIFYDLDKAIAKASANLEANVKNDKNKDS